MTTLKKDPEIVYACGPPEWGPQEGRTVPAWVGRPALGRRIPGPNRVAQGLVFLRESDPNLPTDRLEMPGMAVVTLPDCYLPEDVVAVVYQGSDLSDLLRSDPRKIVVITRGAA